MMFACAYGAAFGAIQQMPRIVPGLPEVRDACRCRSNSRPRVLVQGVPGIRRPRRDDSSWRFSPFASSHAARLLHIFQIPGLIVLPLVFCYAGTHSLELGEVGHGPGGIFTVAQLSFWGNYLPRVYPTHLRGTGEGFAANIGGRMLGTGFAFVTTQLTNVMPGATPPTRLAYAAALVGFAVYFAGFIASWFMPEPKGQALPE